MIENTGLADLDMDAVVDGVLTRFCKDESDLDATNSSSM
jgi:hypothetical protein